MSNPKPPEAYAGEKDDTTGVAVEDGIPYAYEPTEDGPEFEADVYRLTGYFDLTDEPRTNRYYIPSGRLNAFLGTAAKSGEIIVDIRPMTWDEAEAEMAEYQGDG